jgi:hypothetical protein
MSTEWNVSQSLPRFQTLSVATRKASVGISPMEFDGMMQRGNEFGGYATADDASLVSYFDGAPGEATCMFDMPSGEAGFEVRAQHETARHSSCLRRMATWS